MPNAIRRTGLTRRALTRGAAAGGTLVAAPRPLRHALAEEKSDLRVAVLLPLSGVQAQLGQACIRGAELANDVFADMKIGVKLDIMRYDTESNADVARTQAEKAIAAGAHILTGAFDSGHTMAIAQVAEQKSVPIVVNIAATPALTESGFKYLVRNFPTAPMLVTGALALQKDLFAATGRTPRTAVLTSVNDTYGEAMMKAIPGLARKLEMPYEIVEVISYDPKAKDLSAEVAKAKATKAELVMPVSRLNDAKLLIQEMVKQRYEPMGIVNPGAPGLYAFDFLKTMGRFANFHISNGPWTNPKSPMTQALERRFTATYRDGHVDTEVAFTFEALLVAADAWKRTRSHAGSELMEALRRTDIKHHVTTGGPIQFDANGQNVNIAAVAVQNLRNRPMVVLPAEFAVAKPVFPMPGWHARERG